MSLMRILISLLLITLSSTPIAFAADEPKIFVLQPIEPLTGSWLFSGTVANESGERYGYFFQMHRQGSLFTVKTAVIDGQTKQMKLFYEDNQSISATTALNWQVGHSFMRYNPINNSWVFGVKLDDRQGFNFKVDMLKQPSRDQETLALRPGVELQAVQTSRLNGHLKVSSEPKEQFVTSNNAWFGKLWFSKKQTSSHDISTTFCRLSNDNGFYSANLKEADATQAAIAGWRDAAGNKVKMSQFISIKDQSDHQYALHIGVPKLHLNIINTLKHQENMPLAIAGFSQDDRGFCFVSEQTFAEVKNSADEHSLIG